MIPAPDRQPTRIAAMFDAIAHRYDLLNHVLSAGLDFWWRARGVRALGLTGAETVLDLCSGTADLAIAATGRRPGARRVVGIDFSSAMLRVGQEKLGRLALSGRVPLVQADASCLPVRPGSVDAAMVAFGIRNVQDPARAAREVYRALRPGGRFVVLEFGIPRPALMRAVYLWYFRHVLPWVGRLVSQHEEAYSYLPASVDTFFSPHIFAELLETAGFERVTAAPLSLGIVYMYVADRR